MCVGNEVNSSVVAPTLSIRTISCSWKRRFSYHTFAIKSTLKQPPHINDYSAMLSKSSKLYSERSHVSFSRNIHGKFFPNRWVVTAFYEFLLLNGILTKHFWRAIFCLLAAILWNHSGVFSFLRFRWDMRFSSWGSLRNFKQHSNVRLCGCLCAHKNEKVVHGIKKLLLDLLDLA